MGRVQAGKLLPKLPTVATLGSAQLVIASKGINE